MEIIQKKYKGDTYFLVELGGADMIVKTEYKEFARTELRRMLKEKGLRDWDIDSTGKRVYI